MYKTTQDILAALADGVSLVTFTKRDGTDTTRRVVRDPSLIPSDKHPTGGDTRRDNGGFVPCFDLDKGAWIQFHPHSLVAITKA